MGQGVARRVTASRRPSFSGPCASRSDHRRAPRPPPLTSAPSLAGAAGADGADDRHARGTGAGRTRRAGAAAARARPEGRAVARQAQGRPPNNWLDATGYPAWRRDQANAQYFLLAAPRGQRHPQRRRTGGRPRLVAQAVPRPDRTALSRVPPADHTIPPMGTVYRTRSEAATCRPVRSELRAFDPERAGFPLLLQV
jgi:hypothetical protein